MTGYWTVFLIAVGLAMDAFAVSVAAGASIRSPRFRHYFRLAFHFGLFQFFMPILGHVLGAGIEKHIREFDHWVAFLLLGVIGLRMIRESLKEPEMRERHTDPSRGFSLVILSVATSIDALAVGISFGVLSKPILIASAIIGITCSLFSATGVYLGARARLKLGRIAELMGGLILIAIGVKIVVEHTAAG